MSIADLDLDGIELPDIEESDQGYPQFEDSSLGGDLFTGNNKRRHERRSVTWEVSGIWRSGVKFEALTSNISASGMLLLTGKMAKVGDKAYLKIKGFVYGQTYEFDIVVVVRRASLCQDHFNCGVEFVALKTTTKQFIKDFVMGRNPFLMRELRNEKSIRDLESKVTEELMDGGGANISTTPEEIDLEE